MYCTLIIFDDFISEARSRELEAMKALKYIITNSELDDLCENCNCKVVTIYKKEGDERLERLRNHNPKDESQDDKKKNGDANPQKRNPEVVVL